MADFLAILKVLYLKINTIWSYSVLLQYNTVPNIVFIETERIAPLQEFSFLTFLTFDLGFGTEFPIVGFGNFISFLY